MCKQYQYSAPSLGRKTNTVQMNKKWDGKNEREESTEDKYKSQMTFIWRYKKQYAKIDMIKKYITLLQ